MHFSGCSFAAPLSMKNAFHCISGILGAPWSRCGAACLLPGGPSDKGHFGVMAQLRGMGTGNTPPHSPLCSSIDPSVLTLKTGQVLAIILKITDLK